MTLPYVLLALSCLFDLFILRYVLKQGRQLSLARIKVANVNYLRTMEKRRAAVVQREYTHTIWAARNRIQEIKAACADSCRQCPFSDSMQPPAGGKRLTPKGRP